MMIALLSFSLVVQLTTAQWCYKSCDLETKQADFALKLLWELEANATAQIVSPIPIGSALAAILSGAQENTRTEIIHLLASGASQQEIVRWFSTQTAQISTGMIGYDIKQSSKILFNDQIDINEAYCNAVRGKFVGLIERVNFEMEQVEKSVSSWFSGIFNRFNRWVEGEWTQAKMHMEIMNAMIYRAEWEIKFNEEETMLKEFYYEQALSRQVEMMKVIEYFHLYEDSTVRVLALPFINRAVYMYIIMPTVPFTLEKLERELRGEMLIKIMQEVEEERIIEVEMPKFEIEKTNEFSSVLQKLGLNEAFTMQANFNGISATSMSLNRIHQHVGIKISEEGRVAAQSFSAAALLKSPPLQFHANQPFLYVLAKESKIMFIGRYY